MSPAPEDASRAAALRVLVRVDEGAWSDRLLRAEEARLAARRERAFLHLLVLTTLRWQCALDGVLAPLIRQGLGGLDASVLAALRLGLAQACLLEKAPHVAVSTSVALARASSGRGAAGLVNAVLRKALAGGAPALRARDALPPWLRERWARNFGEARCLALCEASVRPARPFLVGLDDDVQDRLPRELEAAGLALAASPRVAGAWHVLRGVPQNTSAFEEGRVLLVDEGAALVAALARPSCSGPIADLAAAPGGKATLLARRARLPLVALEPVGSRARELRAALALRAPRAEWAVLRGDARSAPLAESRFGTVLLDAPCSGSGTLRRRPEKRHRLAERDIARSAQLQRAMLTAAARLVMPGGSLVYAVCSLEPEEGRDVIEGFLRDEPDFRPVNPREVLGDSARGLLEGGATRLETRPESEESEGFVAARFERSPA